VVDACNDKVNFKFLYDLKPAAEARGTDRQGDLRCRRRFLHAGSRGQGQAVRGRREVQRLHHDDGQTHLSLTHRSHAEGSPQGLTLPIRDFLIYGGARFICPVAGNISLMRGTGSDPAYRRVDVDVETGRSGGCSEGGCTEDLEKGVGVGLEIRVSASTFIDSQRVDVVSQFPAAKSRRAKTRTIPAAVSRRLPTLLS